MKDELNEERLGKIVELAKKGEGGEKTTAIALVQKFCKKYDLDFDIVMGKGGEKIQEFVIRCKKRECDLLVQVLFRYGIPTAKQSIWTSVNNMRVTFEGTQSSYLEALNAWYVLSRLYYKEEKKIKEATHIAFISKHNLFYQRKKGEKGPTSSDNKADKNILKMAIGLMDNLEDAQIHKTLVAGK